MSWMIYVVYGVGFARSIASHADDEINVTDANNLQKHDSFMEETINTQWLK